MDAVRYPNVARLRVPNIGVKIVLRRARFNDVMPYDIVWAPFARVFGMILGKDLATGKIDTSDGILMPADYTNHPLYRVESE